jgi:hypothetical protein
MKAKLIKEEIENSYPKCLTCIHWKQNTNWNFEGAINTGICDEIGSTITIELKTGWDGGYVDYIETEDNFGCILHENK